jgi:hypothetical protein
MSHLFYFFTVSAQLRVLLLAVGFLESVPAGTDKHAFAPSAGKTVRERGEPPTAISTFNTPGCLKGPIWNPNRRIRGIQVHLQWKWDIRISHNHVTPVSGTERLAKPW